MEFIKEFTGGKGYRDIWRPEFGCAGVLETALGDLLTIPVMTAYDGFF
jgi:hypothetical protein